MRLVADAAILSSLGLRLGKPGCGRGHDFGKRDQGLRLAMSWWKQFQMIVMPRDSPTGWKECAEQVYQQSVLMLGPSGRQMSREVKEVDGR